MNMVSYIARKLFMIAQGLPINFNYDKKQLIDYTYSRCRPVPDSFCDLGGIWNIDGGYTYYILRKYGSKHAFLVDTDFTSRQFWRRIDGLTDWERRFDYFVRCPIAPGKT